MSKDRSTKATLIPQKPGRIPLSQKRQFLALALTLSTFDITLNMATESLQVVIIVYDKSFFCARNVKIDILNAILDIFSSEKVIWGP